MANVTDELIDEVLKRLQQGQTEIKAELQAIRGHMLAFQTAINNLYTSLSSLDTRLERVERRLDLTDERQ